MTGKIRETVVLGVAGLITLLYLPSPASAIPPLKPPNTDEVWIVRGSSEALDNPSIHSDAAQFSLKIVKRQGNSYYTVTLSKGYEGGRTLRTWDAHYKTEIVGYGPTETWQLGVLSSRGPRDSEYQDAIRIVFERPSRGKRRVGGLYGDAATVGFLIWAADSRSGDRKVKLHVRGAKAAIRPMSGQCSKAIDHRSRSF